MARALTGAPGIQVRLGKIAGVTPSRVLGRTVRIPAVTEDFEWEEPAEHNDYQTVRAGEYSQPAYGDQRGFRSLRSSNLDFLTLDWEASWLQETGEDPARVRAALYSIVRSRRPVNLVVDLNHGGFSEEVLRMAVTLRTLTQRIRHGEPDTRYMTLELKEWRDARVERRGAAAGKVRRRKLKATDTLESLSKHYYKTYAGWRAIRDANKISAKWGKATPLVASKRFKVGDIITIPKKPPIATTGDPVKGR